MKLTTKVIMWSWLVIFAVVGSLIYGAYSRLNPDSLVHLLNTQIQRSYPGSNLTIAQIDYGFSLDFKLKLKTLILSRGQKTIASASDVQLKVPWWLILFNRGNASINISNLIVFVSSKPSLDEVNPSVSSSISKAPTSVRFDLPQYLLDAHYTLRAKNVSIKEIDGDRRFFTLSKLLVREFQYGKNSAFELNIPISITHHNKHYTSDLWLFGDITPELKRWSLNYRGEFKTKETAEGLEFDDLVIEGKSTFDPRNVDIVSAIDLSVERKKVGQGKITAKYDKIDLQLKMSDFPLGFLGLIGDEIKNPYWKKIEGVGEGEINFSRTFSDENSSELSAKLRFPGVFNLGPDQHIAGQWQLNFDNEKWKSSFISPKQEIKFERRALLDFKQNKIAQFHQEIHFTSFDVKNAMHAIEPLIETMSPNLTVEHTSVVILTDCTEGDRLISGSFKYGVTPQQNYYQVELNDKKSKFVANYLKKSTQQLSLEFNQFLWSSSFLFLNPFFSASSGVLDGKISGKWEDHWSSGTWLTKLSVDHLQNPTGEFVSFNQKLWDYFSVDSALASKRSWNGNVNKDTITMDSLVLDSVDPASLKGVLTTVPKLKSHLTLMYPKNKKWKPVRKDISDVFWKKETP